MRLTSYAASRGCRTTPHGKIAVGVLASIAFALCISAPTATAQGANPGTYQRPAGSFQIPEFPPGLKWYNVDAPLTMAALRGKMVLLDFWTYG